MPDFEYIARNRDGQQITDKDEADSREALIARLRTEGLLVMEIKQVRRKTAGANRNRWWNPFEYKSMRNLDIEHDFNQLHMMLRGGMPLLESLGVTADCARISVKRVWEKVASHIERGVSFHDALSEHKQFDKFILQLILIGESTGHLDSVLKQASLELEARRKLKKKLISAMMYPTFVIVFAIGVAVFMLVSIVPELKKFLAMVGGTLPPLTVALIDISNWFDEFGAALGIWTLGILVGTVVLYQWKPARYWMDLILLRTPVFGPVFRLSGTVAFARGSSLMMKSGLMIVEVMHSVEKMMGNAYLAKIVSDAARKVTFGSDLTSPLEEQFGFEPLMMRMMRVGETSGTLDTILEEMAIYHEEMLERTIERLTGMISPVMTIVVGGIVGFVYAAFLTAMFSAGGK